MGAEFWDEVFPFIESKEITLKKLQEDVLKEGRYFKPYESVNDKIEKLKNWDYSGVPDELKQDLRDGFEADILRLRNLPKAETLEQKIEILQILNETVGTRSPLDFTGYSDTLDFGKFVFFTEAHFFEFFHKKEVELEEIRQHMNELADTLDREQGYCIPIYDNDEIKYLYFCGLSAY